jgi:uncharacterized membrane protein
VLGADVGAVLGGEVGPVLGADVGAVLGAVLGAILGLAAGVDEVELELHQPFTADQPNIHHIPDIIADIPNNTQKIGIGIILLLVL